MTQRARAGRNRPVAVYLPQAIHAEDQQSERRAAQERTAYIERPRDAAVARHGKECYRQQNDSRRHIDAEQPRPLRHT